MILLITRYNLSPYWFKAIIFIITYLIFSLLCTHISIADCHLSPEEYRAMQGIAADVKHVKDEVKSLTERIDAQNNSITDPMLQADSKEELKAEIINSVKKDLDNEIKSLRTDVFKTATNFDTRYVGEINTLRTGIGNVATKITNLETDMEKLQQDVANLKAQNKIIIDGLSQSRETERVSTYITQHINHINNNHDSSTHFNAEVKQAVVSPTNSTLTTTSYNNNGGTQTNISDNASPKVTGDRKIDCCGCFRSEGDLNANLLNNDSKAEEQNNTCCAPTVGSCSIS